MRMSVCVHEQVCLCEGMRSESIVCVCMSVCVTQVNVFLG